MDFSTLASRERDALECGVRDTAFKSDAVGVAVQSALGADNEPVNFTKIKLLDGQPQDKLTSLLIYANKLEGAGIPEEKIKWG